MPRHCHLSETEGRSCYSYWGFVSLEDIYIRMKCINLNSFSYIYGRYNPVVKELNIIM